MRTFAARPFLVAAVAVALAGCGTTVSSPPQTASQTAGSGLSIPSTPATSTSQGTMTAVPDSGGAAGGPGASSSVTSDTSPTTVVSPDGGRHAPRPTRSSPVRTGKATLSRVRIGFTIAPDAGAFLKSLGASFDTGSQSDELKAAVAWANAHGGLNGHPIQPMIETVSATSVESYDAQYQKLCAKFTQDDHVVAAAMVGIGADENMDACMNNTHTLFVTGSNTLHDETDYRRTPYVVSPSEATASVVAKTMTKLVLDQGIVGRGGRIGLVNYDIGPYDRAIDKYVKPMLAAAGVALSQFTIPPPASTAAIAGAVTVDQAAQLRMSAQGVKTVMFLCAGCLAFFAKVAKSQHYFPRYIFSSLDGPAGGTDKEVFGTSIGIGWEPVTDQDLFAHPGNFTGNETFNLCKKIEKRNITSVGSLTASLDTCEDVMDMVAAARANPTATITSDSLRTGLLSLGRSHQSALDFATDLSPSRHAGASAYRVMKWSDRLKSLSYVGPTRAFPSA